MNCLLSLLVYGPVFLEAFLPFQKTPCGKKFCFYIFFLDRIISAIILIDGLFLQSYCDIIYLVNCSFLGTVQIMTIAAMEPTQADPGMYLDPVVYRPIQLILA